MTIRARLLAAFVTILALFAVNEAIQVWSAGRRERTMATLDRALKRQVLMASVRQRVDNLNKQMSLIGQVEGGGGAAVDRETLNADIAGAAGEIRQLTGLSDEGERAAATDLEQTYVKLAGAWRAFYDALGVDEGRTIAAQVQGEPLGRSVLGEVLRMQKQQTDNVQQAEARFEEVSRLTARVSFGIFGLSMLVAAAVAYLLGRYLTTALSQLSRGAQRIGAMDLEHRIAVTSSDEIGTVARAFNSMAENLARAREALITANSELTARNVEVERQRQVSQSLLLNILPEQVAAELASHGKFAPRYFEDVTILFTDFVGFTLATEKLAADELVDVLHGYFSVFDQISARYGLEKLKTIGDAYFCAGGLPARTPSHPVDAVLAALEIVHEVGRRSTPGGGHWSIRVGLHTGPVVAGVVGIRKFAFDVWGDTVNLASRMESGGAPNRINVSETVYRRTKDFFGYESRGRVVTKEKKELEMFSVTGLLPTLAAADGQAVPPAFAQRYRTYFGKELPAFPPFLLGRVAQTQAVVGESMTPSTAE